MRILKPITVLTLAIAAAGFAWASISQAAEGYDLSPEQKGRIRVATNKKAIAAIPPHFKFVTPGKFTIASAVGGPPLNSYPTDAQTVVGSDPDYASAIADSLGLQLEIIPVAWADWSLGLTSGKYDTDGLSGRAKLANDPTRKRFPVSSLHAAKAEILQNLGAMPPGRSPTEIVTGQLIGMDAKLFGQIVGRII